MVSNLDQPVLDPEEDRRWRLHSLVICLVAAGLAAMFVYGIALSKQSFADTPAVHLAMAEISNGSRVMAVLGKEIERTGSVTGSIKTMNSGGLDDQSRDEVAGIC